MHPDLGVRAKLAKTVLSLGRSFPEYRKILRQLTHDQVDDIATLAAVDLARLGERVSAEMVDRIIQYLTQARGLYGKAETLFYSLSALGQDSARIYQSLLGHASASMRAKAWERHLSISEGWKSPDKWIPALSDRDLQVRSSILSMVRGRVEKIGANELKLLVAHQYPEVRALAAELLVVAENEAVHDSHFELLIDDDSLVRSTSLRALAHLRFKGWVNLHARSLKDDDYAIQRAAMDGLLGDSKEGVPALIKYIQKYPVERISSLARTELKKMGLNP
ncbi:MAG: HEAT repeat domain-containing protein [Opitutae bacterium]